MKLALKNKSTFYRFLKYFISSYLFWSSLGSYFHMVYNNQEDKNFSLKEKKKKWFLHSLSSLEAGASKNKIRKTMRAGIKSWVLTLLQKGS